MAGQFGYRTAPAKHVLWWLEPSKAAHEAIFSEVERIQEVQGMRNAALNHYLRMYSNRASASLSASSFADGIDVNGERIRLNIVKSAIDATVAQCATNRCRPLYLTVGGNYAMRKRAERRGKFITGQFHMLQQHMTSLKVFRDAAIFGTGFQRVCAAGSRIIAERVIPDEILVDDNDGRDGNPLVMFQCTPVNRAVLKARFPKAKELIDDARCISTDTSASFLAQDPVTVVEAWRRPSTPDSEDGRHVLCISNCSLVDEAWNRTFPIIPYHWDAPLIGYFGIGCAEELSPIQVEINYIAQKIQKLMTLATSMVWKEKGSVISPLDNRDWAEREYVGRPPVFQTTSSVSAEYFHHLDRLYQLGYEIAGISQLSASARKPAGLDSGEALKTYHDISTQRFQHKEQCYEQFHLDVAEAYFAAAKQIKETSGEDLRVLSGGDKEIEELLFSQVDIPKEKYIVRPHPISVIPDTPAGKLEAIQRLAQIAPQLGPYLLGLMTGIPDIDAAVALANAPTELAEKVVSGILEKGEYVSPDPLWNLPVTRDIAQRSLLRATIDGAEASNMELLRRFVEDIDNLQALATAGAGLPPAALLGGPAGAMGGPSTEASMQEQLPMDPNAMGAGGLPPIPTGM